MLPAVPGDTHIPPEPDILTMDNGAIVTSSAEYTKEALWGQWGRWLVFIACGLPMAAIPLLLDPEKIVEGSAFRWDLVPWTEIAVLACAAFLLSFVLSGYVARVYRGSATPPAFDRFGSLYIDGIKVAVTGFLWFVPVALIAVALLATIFLMLAGDGIIPSALAILLVIVLALLELVAGIVAILYSIPGVVRCARMNSIREGIRFSALTDTIRTIGWVNYIVALIVLFVAGIVFFIVMSFFSLNAYTGAAASLILSPLYTIFSARYIALVYDAAPAPAPAEQPAV